jgi:hypothetical protein
MNFLMPDSKNNVIFDNPIARNVLFFFTIDLNNLIKPFMKLIFTSPRFSKFPKVFLLAFVFLFSVQYLSVSASGFFDDSDILKINPDYKIKRYPNGTVIAYSLLADGEKVVHDFTNFNADVLLAALRKQRVENVILNLSRKYRLSEDECRRNLKHAVNVLEEWDIIMAGDRFLTNR